MAWPHADTDWAPILSEAQQCVVNIVKELLDNNISVIIVGPSQADILTGLTGCYDTNRHAGLLRIFEVPTNDTWARDFGPITTIDCDNKLLFNDFKFNGWGLKFAANLDNLVTSRLFHLAWKHVGTLVNRRGFVLEGGSIESDGHGTILTTSRCLLSANRNGNMSRDQIVSYLCDHLGAQRVLWLEHGALYGDDTDSHIDTLARFVDEHTIVFCGAGDEDDAQHDELRAMAEELASLRRCDGLSYNLVELPLPDPMYDEDGHRLPGTYANFLITNGVVLMPTYRQPQKDLLARQILEAIFPGHRVLTVDCSVLVKQHGSLHCMTMQIPANQ